MNVIDQARIFRILTAFVCAFSLGSHAHAGDDSPWATLAEYPEDVDIALVLDNPAERMLLGGSGVSAREMFASLGLFTQTERAWGALADTFGLGSDEAIRALLSNRVVVLFDRMGESFENPSDLFRAADDHWALIAEVDNSLVPLVYNRLKPVPRRIHNGRLIYAIEHGRFHIVILDEKQSMRPPRILLAPKGGGALIDRVIDSQDTKQTRPARSYLGTRSSEIAGALDEGWVLAGALAIDQFFPQPSNPDSPDPDNPRAVCTIVIDTLDDLWGVSLATDMDFRFPNHDAPVELLGAVGGDAALALAYAGNLSITPSESSFSIGYQLSTRADPDSPNTKGGSILVVSRGAEDTDDDSRPVVQPILTLLTGMFVDRADAPRSADRAIQKLVSDPHSRSSPQFYGQFPAAIRTQPLARAQSNSDVPQENRATKFEQISWICRSGRNRDDLVLALGPRNADTASRVRWIVEAANSLDAIAQTENGTSVLMRGFIQLREWRELMNDDPDGIVSTMTGSLREVTWDVRRAPFGVRGDVKLHWISRTGSGQLGRNRFDP